MNVCTLKNQFEADIIKDELEKENIPVLIRSFRDTAYDGIYMPQKGWGEVRVPEKDKERATEIIDILEKSFEEEAVDIPESEELKPAWQATPVGRMVKPEDVANVVVFLCSEQAFMIRGQTIIVDGGISVTPYWPMAEQI